MIWWVFLTNDGIIATHRAHNVLSKGQTPGQVCSNDVKNLSKITVEIVFFRMVTFMAVLRPCVAPTQDCDTPNQLGINWGCGKVSSQITIFIELDSI